MLVDLVHGTTDEGKVALLHGTYVGDVDGLTEGDFEAVMHEVVLHGTSDQSSIVGH